MSLRVLFFGNSCSTPNFWQRDSILWEGSAMEPLATPSHPDAGPWADADAKELTHGGMAEDEGLMVHLCSTWELIDADSVNCGAFLLGNVWIQTDEAMCCGWKLLEVAETCRCQLSCFFWIAVSCARHIRSMISWRWDFSGDFSGTVVPGMMLWDGLGFREAGKTFLRCWGSHIWEPASSRDGRDYPFARISFA